MEELNRHRAINKYTQTMILEQDMGADAAVPAIPPADPLAVAPPVEGAPADPLAAPPAEGAPVDAAAPPVEGAPAADATGGTEEIDITDLVKSQKNVEKKQEEYFDNLFKHLTDLESKLADMDNIMNKLNDLETKIEKIRPKTPEEKLELRSLDSGPYNQKLSDFFEDKMEDMEKSGKNEYVLTQDDVESYSPGDIKNSFRDFGSNVPEPDAFKQVR